MIKFKKPKIIIFNPSIEDGGVEKNLFLITNYLIKKNYQIDLISSDINKKKKFLPGLNFIHSNFLVKKNSSRYIKYLSCLLSLSKIILKDKNCIIISFQANIYSIILSLFFNVKLIARLNTAPHGWAHNYFKNIIYSYFIKKANATIVNSIDFKKEIERRYLIKTTFINNPFDFDKISRLSNKKIKYPFQRKINIITVGRLTEQKDQITLLRSILYLKNKDKFRFTIIGKGKEKKNLYNFISKNKLKKYVRLLGYKNNPYPYIKKSDIFVLTSKYEGSPNVLVEARFLKKYIISTNCPTGPAEILKDYKQAKLFKIGDYKKLATLIDNFKLKKKNNIFKKIKSFDLTSNCEKYIKLINKIYNDNN